MNQLLIADVRRTGSAMSWFHFKGSSGLTKVWLLTHSFCHSEPCCVVSVVRTVQAVGLH